MGDKTPNIQNGNRVLFVGGPEAGNIRVIPESFGDVVKSEGDYLYKIWPFRMKGSTQTMYLAYAADQHPMNMLLDMWREYSPAAQIKRGTGGEMLTYQKAKPSP